MHLSREYIRFNETPAGPLSAVLVQIAAFCFVARSKFALDSRDGASFNSLAPFNRSVNPLAIHRAGRRRTPRRRASARRSGLYLRDLFLTLPLRGSRIEIRLLISDHRVSRGCWNKGEICNLPHARRKTRHEAVIREPVDLG